MSRRSQLQKVETSTRTSSGSTFTFRSPMSLPVWSTTAVRRKLTRTNARRLSFCHCNVLTSSTTPHLLCIQASVPRAYVSQLSPPMWLRNYIERQSVDPPPISKQLPCDVIAILIADSRDSMRPINASRLTLYRDDFHGIRECITKN